MRWFALPLVVVVLAVGCGPTEEEMAAEAAAVAAAAQDSMMAEAVAMFDASVFDTLTWETPEKRADRGAQVYNFSCARCHGSEGLGDGGFVMAGDTLRPPSFREPTWAMAGDEPAVRRAIFVGTKEGMPHWGLEGLKAEAVDAVAAYVVSGLGSD
ncbi:MAG: c-type cytochrome [Gemmatimonadetes bacterium]|nr:cytochrome c [Gemmatimonadota bacterium]NNM06741.1 c-type cytochrome [Gemmatimonadota bacterium]